MTDGLDHLRRIATPSRLAASLCKQVTGRDFQMYRWLQHVEKRILEAVMDPEWRFLIVNLPPRCGKTFYSGIWLPSWFLGMFPDKRVMFTTYSDDFSVRFGRTVRTVLDRFGHEYFGVGVSREAQAASDWYMQDTLGGMLSTGVGGVITGLGGDLIIIDDILKNIQEARSQATKSMHVDWYDSTLRSRLEPGGTIILTATRWAEDDLSGSLLERMKEPGYEGDQWECIALPALAEPDQELQIPEAELAEWRDELGRAVGESLNPEKFSAAQYERIRANNADQYTWSCLYQQRPRVPDGGMFPYTKWKEYDPEGTPPLRRKVRCWDLATTEGAGDWTVGVLMGQSRQDDLYVLERQRFRRSTSEVEKAVKETAARDGFGTVIIIEQEKAGAGKAVVEYYQRLLPGYTVVPGKASDGTKEQRATPYSSMQQLGRVYLPRGADWLREWKQEHAGMMGDGRRPRHDDQIDTAAYCALELLGTQSSDIWVPGQDVLAGGRQWGEVLVGRNPYFTAA